MVFNILLMRFLNRINSFIDVLLDLPEHIVLAFLYSVVFIIGFMNEDVDLHLQVLHLYVLINIHKVLNGFLIRFLLHIDEIDNTLCVHNLREILWLCFIDIKRARKIKEV